MHLNPKSSVSILLHCNVSILRLGDNARGLYHDVCRISKSLAWEEPIEPMMGLRLDLSAVLAWFDLVLAVGPGRALQRLSEEPGACRINPS